LASPLTSTTARTPSHWSTARAATIAAPALALVERPAERVRDAGDDFGSLITLARPQMRVVIADEHRLMLYGISHALEAAPDIQVVGEAVSAQELFGLLPRVRPDVILMDVQMTSDDGFRVLARVRSECPDAKVVVLSSCAEPQSIEKVLAAGAAGYVVKAINPLDLASAIRQAVEGTVYHPWGRNDGSRAEAPAANNNCGLSDRQLSILSLVAEGMSNPQIAGKLYITEQTVKFHLSNIYRKLGVGNRTEAIRFAFRQRMIAS
jgi:DNA-binding NarL/FixJ family response regulator